jgi:uncharacterized tellurite resistance protein B-like protein
MNKSDFVAESLSLFRLLLGHNDLGDDEREVFREIAWKRFGIPASDFEPLQKELSGLADESISIRVIGVFRELPYQRRLALAQELGAIADSHAELRPYRERIVERIADILLLEPEAVQGAA